jgi:hypothetical protein
MSSRLGTRRRPSNPPKANPIQAENAKTGTADWQLTNPATSNEIEGYASLTSVNRGGSIRFFVNTVDPTYTVDIFRLGWYGGAGGRRVADAVQHTGTKQAIPPPDPETGLIECRWINPITQPIPFDRANPTEWASGFYVAKLTGSSGKQSYIVFVVRDDERASTYLFVSAVATYQAYNDWGGKSLYAFNSSAAVPTANTRGTPEAIKVSFNRPYAISNRALHPDPLAGAGCGVGTGQCINIPAPAAETFPAGWEYNMVRFLEREGYDVAYADSLDLHTNDNLLRARKGYLSVGHDEYWSAEMRSNVTAARDQGVGLGFFSSNNIYWQVRFETDSNAVPNRTMVCYKDTSDPLFATHPSLTTVQFRQPPVNSPEDGVIGVMYVDDPADTDIVVQNASHWAFAFTGLRDGDHLPGLLGYEVDKFCPSSLSSIPSSPPNTIPLAHSPYPDPHYNPGQPDGAPTRYADMTIYSAASGALVFAAGTMQLAWGLDNYNAEIQIASGSPGIRPPVLNPQAQQIARNVLNAFVNPPAVAAVPVPPIRVSAGGPASTDASGTIWEDDQGFDAGEIFSATSPIDNTASPDLYQTQRTGSSFSYSFAAPPGVYVVTLKFAELFHDADGQRLFNVGINSVQVLRDFDVVGQAGGGLRAVDRIFTVTSNGQIKITFGTGAADTPIVNAISIRQAGAETILVNAGGAAYTEPPDTNWDADYGFSAGSTNSTSSPISNTTTPDLYQTQRVGDQGPHVVDFSYLFMAPAGTYAVTLKFAELDHKAPGQRVFNVLINGVAVLSDFDVVAQAGAPLTALDRTFTLYTPGQIAIHFQASHGDSAIVNAIGIAAVSPGPVPVSAVHVNAGGFSYTDASGIMWDDYGASGGAFFGAAEGEIHGTATPFLYRTQRYGVFTYQFSIPSGEYVVTLKFAELFYRQAGQRVFDVSINGTAVLSNFDVVNEAGHWKTPLDRSFPVAVSSGQIIIQFSEGLEDVPIVNAIEILSVPPGT